MSPIYPPPPFSSSPTLSTQAVTNTLGDRWLYQLQNASIPKIRASNFDLVTIDYSNDGSQSGRYTRQQINSLQRQGKTVLAYLSIGEAEDYRYYFKQTWVSPDSHTQLNQPDGDAPPWLGLTNPDWQGNYKTRYWLKAWQNVVFGYLKRIVNAGFDGVYLDIIDAFEYWSNKNNDEGLTLTHPVAAQRMITFVKRIAHYARKTLGKPDFAIVPQNGENILAYDQTGVYLKTISGIGVEDLFYNETQPQPSADIQFRLKWLERIDNAGKAVLVVDYVDNGNGYQGSNRNRIDDFRQKVLDQGYVPYAAVSDRELDTINLIPGIQD